MTATIISLAERRRIDLFHEVRRHADPYLHRALGDVARDAKRTPSPTLAFVDPRDELGYRVLSRVPFVAVSLVEAAGRRIAVVLASAEVVASLLDFDRQAAARVERALELPELRVAIVAFGGVSLATTVVATNAAVGPTRSA